MLGSFAFSAVVRTGNFLKYSQTGVENSYLIQQLFGISSSRCLLECLLNLQCLSVVIGQRRCLLFSEDPRSFVDDSKLLRNHSAGDLYLANPNGIQCNSDNAIYQDSDACDMKIRKRNSICSEWSEKTEHVTMFCNNNSRIITHRSQERNCTQPLNGGVDCPDKYWRKVEMKVPHHSNQKRVGIGDWCGSYGESFTGVHLLLEQYSGKYFRLNSGYWIHKLWTQFKIWPGNDFASLTKDPNEQDQVISLDCDIWNEQLEKTSRLESEARQVYLHHDQLMVDPANGHEAFQLCDNWEVNKTASLLCSDHYFSVLNNET